MGIFSGNTRKDNIIMVNKDEKERLKAIIGKRVEADREGFAMRLRNARLQNDYSNADDFGNKLLTIGSAAYRRYERAETEPSFTTLKEICDRLKVSETYLIRGI